MSLCHAMLWEVSSINHHLPLAHHLHCIERASQYRVALLYLYLCSAEPESPVLSYKVRLNCLTI